MQQAAFTFTCIKIDSLHNLDNSFPEVCTADLNVPGGGFFNPAGTIHRQCRERREWKLDTCSLLICKCLGCSCTMGGIKLTRASLCAVRMSHLS